MSNYSITQSRFRISVAVNGTDYGTWDKITGGDLKSNVTAYNPGGGGTQEALSGTQTVNALTVTRSYNLARDHAAVPALRAACGTGVVTVKQIPLDNDGNAYGKALVWTGILDTVTTPEADSTSNTPATIALEITPNGNPTGGGS